MKRLWKWLSRPDEFRVLDRIVLAVLIIKAFDLPLALVAAVFAGLLATRLLQCAFKEKP